VGTGGSSAGYSGDSGMKPRTSGSSTSGTTASGSAMMNDDHGGRKGHKEHKSNNGKDCPPGLEKQGRC
jgi:hypothetical protein